MAKGYYENHHKLKRVRIIKLKEVKGKCEICKEQGNCIHHIDEDQNNHTKENLLVVCQQCHSLIHSGSGKRKAYTSKYSAIYGKTLAQISRDTGQVRHRIEAWHHSGVLAEFLSTGIVPKGTSKYRRIYGLTLKEMEFKLHTSMPRIMRLHKAGKLERILQDTA